MKPAHVRWMNLKKQQFYVQVAMSAWRFEACLQGWKANEEEEMGGQRENSELRTGNNIGGVGKKTQMKIHES